VRIISAGQRLRRFHSHSAFVIRHSLRPATIVGILPMEDFYVVGASVKLFLPSFKMSFPEIVDIALPAEGVKMSGERLTRCSAGRNELQSSDWRSIMREVLGFPDSLAALQAFRPSRGNEPSLRGATAQQEM
jgi:hypothetical protein